MAEEIRDLETDLVMVIGQLSWFADVLEDHDDNLNEAMVLRGMIQQLQDMVNPIADLEREVRRAKVAA